MIKKLLLLLIVAGAAYFAYDHFELGSGAQNSVENEKVKISNYVARASVAKNSAAFMTIDNKTDQDDKLISAAADISERVELHNHLMEEGVMKMRKVDHIPVPANAQAILKPGSFHVMFMGLKDELKEDTQFKLSLTFEKAGVIEFDIPVGHVAAAHKSH